MTTTENTTTTAESTDTELDAEQAAAVLGGVDLTDALSVALRKAVNAQVTAAAKEIATGAINDFLTEDVIATMRETALLEAEAAVNPDAAAVVGAVAEPEPESEPEPEEKPRQLHHARLDLFVEKYIAHTYRREVSRKGTESKIRWCPQWWDHAEAVGRLDALWMAWEQMRLGEGSEMAAWWTQFADPLMAALFDPEGVFKYCSVADGHRPSMKVLPTVPAPAGWFQDGHAHDVDVEPGLTASGLYLPTPSPGRARVVVALDEFPG
ncbi:DUF4913 domain-containing protein [Nocardia alba]|uniref:Uncharacterized protein DUF4913 n=1 Tax=Nocardia alba TaxID=225051 RepID=A0A4R1FGL0_9NOCA|nr:DUF4913 domain-containing protein [Nocardia alba]TCJ89981.1 uncharacterized protein DUF4913 [Nocardia alba]